VADADGFGGNAAHRGELIRAGFEVPPGLVLPGVGAAQGDDSGDHSSDGRSSAHGSISP
jgi:hypothetical protein